MEDKKQGYVYILTNPSFKEDWVKIGKSSRPVDVRSKELDNTAVPLPFEIYATMRTAKYSEAEKLIHRFIETLTSLRIRDNREFFNLKPEKALEIFRQVASILDDAVVEEVHNSPMRKIENVIAPKPERRVTRSSIMSGGNSWMIPANPNFFDVDGCLNKFGMVYWRQHYNFQTGDIVYLYVSSPVCSLRYKCIVEEHDLPHSPIVEIDKEFFVKQSDFATTRNHNRYVKLTLLDTSYSEMLNLHNLLAHGMNSAPQGCINLSQNKFSHLLEYIENNF
ncbi:MAG: GIY-YIG nuclease family protein [Bacteroidales bacterium]|nr:GIY-YIG nuclease family protein [Bacteroidales bacterium]